MKLPPFDYEAPRTVSEAVELLAEHLDEASVLAGGQSLIPLLALRLARPAVLIDIRIYEQHLPPARILELIAAFSGGGVRAGDGEGV